MLGADNVIAAFSEEQVERLTGLTRAQLRYWHGTGFFAPSLAGEDRRLPYSRIYSFRDIVALRVLGVLRQQFSVPLQHLRKVAEKLAHLAEAKRTKTTLYVANRRVVFQEPGDTAKRLREVVSGQYVIPSVPLHKVIADTERDVAAMRKRPESKIGRVERSRSVGRNVPVIAGTRIPISVIKRFADDGYTVQQILEEYPTLTETDITAAIRYESDGLAA